ncbi:phage tail protein [Nocardioides sp. TRM66260-LWL]|uniref:phage tail protein n=1 Tax=Nocardioides sp. TRM66260-LWL TaxID=2874478 RepID=UPI001CC7080F|nr:phage tail protein [Nocardioides sp. TRM66260-LWL]MBZ5736092.1 phage tail protein [Nocardioides sp. TRM66260-LWL]
MPSEPVRTAVVATLAALGGALLAVPIAATARGADPAPAPAATSPERATAPVVLCVARRGGAVRVVSSTARCRDAERAVVVPTVRRGPAGPAGPAGPGATVLGTDTSDAAEGRQADCTVGEVRLFAGAVGDAVPADGRELSINQNNALFALIGNRFGGDGRTTFALPDLRAAAPNGLTYQICTTGTFPTAP